MTLSPTEVGDTTAANVVDHEEPAIDDDQVDLESIEADLDGVQAALARLADGTYWTDEVTGDAIADEVLAAAPLTRRA